MFVKTQIDLQDNQNDERLSCQNCTVACLMEINAIKTCETNRLCNKFPNQLGDNALLLEN
jgi:hypothetical protein